MKNIIVSALPLLFLSAAIPSLPAGQIHREDLQKQDIVLLQRVEDTAHDVMATTENIESYNRMPNVYSRECHLLQLDALKDQINAMTRDLDRLAASRNGLDRADQKAVTRVLMVASELAQNANAAIVKAGAISATPALSPEYRKLMDECNREAGDLVKALGAGIVELK